MPLHDPPEAEAMSLQVVGRLTTQTASWGLELVEGAKPLAIYHDLTALHHDGKDLDRR